MFLVQVAWPASVYGEKFPMTDCRCGSFLQRGWYRGGQGNFLCCNLYHHHSGSRILPYRIHGWHIDRESCQIHHKEGSDKRNGDHDAGYKCYTPVTQKEEDDDDNENECYVYRFLYLIDRGAYKFGIVLL